MKKQIQAIICAIVSRQEAGESIGRAYCSGIRDVLGDERVQPDGSFVSPTSRWLSVDSEMAWAARLAQGSRRKYLAALSALEGIARACGANGRCKWEMAENGDPVRIDLFFPLEDRNAGDRHDSHRWRVAAGRAFFAERLRTAGLLLGIET